MRRLRVLISMASGAPILVGASLVPGAACGDVAEETAPSATDASPDVPPIDQQIVAEPFDAGRCTNLGAMWKTVVEIPEPGTPARIDQVCLVASGSVDSSAAASVNFTSYDRNLQTAVGSIKVPSDILTNVVGLPTIRVVDRYNTEEFTVTNLAPAPGGFRFDAKWPTPVVQEHSAQMLIEVDLQVQCPDAGLKIVTGSTSVYRCLGERDGEIALVSSGECTSCEIIAEMAPTPIVSDNRGDDLPLGRVIGLRVRELARIGNRVVLLAENDGGSATSYEWRISGGELERLADDVALWTVPEGDPLPFGQLAVWNDAGAAVENFVWKAAS